MLGIEKLKTGGYKLSLEESFDNYPKYIKPWKEKMINNPTKTLKEINIEVKNISRELKIEEEKIPIEDWELIKQKEPGTYRVKWKKTDNSIAKLFKEPGTYRVKWKKTDNSKDTFDIAKLLKDVRGKLKEKIECNPLVLFNECTSGCCGLSRELPNHLRENMISNNLAELIQGNKIKTICSFGPGYFFQDIEILSKSFKENSNLEFWIIEQLKDYFKCIPSFDEDGKCIISGHEYNGPSDEQKRERALWFCFQTMRFLSLLHYFKANGWVPTILVFDNISEYENYPVHPELTYGIDLMEGDLYDEYAIQDFIRAVYSHKTLGFTVSTSLGDFYLGAKNNKTIMKGFKLPKELTNGQRIEFIYKMESYWDLIKLLSTYFWDGLSTKWKIFFSAICLTTIAGCCSKFLNLI